MRKGVGSGEDEEKRSTIRAGLAQVTWVGGAGVEKKYWGRPGKWACWPAMRHVGQVWAWGDCW